MADISMCVGTNCPLKDQCYRYTAPVNPQWQAYFVHVPFNGASCEMFLNNSETKTT